MNDECSIVGGPEWPVRAEPLPTCWETHVLASDPDFVMAGKPHVHDGDLLIWLVSDDPLPTRPSR